MRIGLAQLRLENMDKNVRKALDLLRKSKADVVVFPELFNTGYNLENISKSDPKFLIEASKETKAVIIAGIPEKGYNTALVIHRGKILGRHRKTKLFPLLNEHKIFKAGKVVKPIETPFGLFGIMICYELRFPEIARKLVNKGAKILFVIAQFPSERIEHWKVLLRARAIENQVFVVGVNCVNDHCGGYSMVVDPLGNVLKELGDCEAYDEVDINIKYVDEVRKKYPFLNSP
ncbi:nitrilase-related carbon-nitrogen hydrolase [Archaeoglobus profundus]|uniref:Nitrilase/cyanide hydratase and apolipoprotein N-acyltransferase n=1 Tax=Archaeoglobus profundus (strain DSM 5631 / JCM 9629 / NBRC 100127 / Av18) TaxID=572546 RepID=D2RHR5_ARCPA|nr:nitrilase-related carbon-nitrogen hydrolase [Archaeoglobus profundus]ADB57840.1 Nitrilase/cyanide hydratase and apolipoprotein N- acyltransferase [Archaeoglobus profundus DSM 5631]